MHPLPCGERLVRCLIGEEVDRIPFGVGIGWAPWGQTVERWRTESGRADLDPCQELGFDASFACPAIEPGVFPYFEPTVLEETLEFVVSRNERGISMRNFHYAANRIKEVCLCR